MSGHEGTSEPKGRRSALPWAAVGLGVGLLAGCVRIGLYPCDLDSQCVLDGREGICAEAGFCALPDDGCDSGYRFHERGVPGDLAGQCTPPLAVDTTTGTSGEATSDSTDSTGSTTLGSGSSSSASSSEGSSGTTGSECGDHPCPCTLDLAVGANHTCVARTDGDVTCWGANNNGQMGTGIASGPTLDLKSVLLPGEATAEVIRSGGEHVCVLDTETLLCWGRNNNNQIVPEGAEVLTPQPMAVDGPPGAVGLGLEHSCVAEPGGPGLQCLGNNGKMELGGGDSTLPGMQTIDELAIGDDHSCARAGGRVWCWGSDDHGQIGQDAMVGPTPAKTEVVLPGDAVAIVAGSDHTCVATAGGATVRCWGRNDNGQVGNGSKINRQVPTLIATQPPTAVIMLDATVDTTCALLEDGDLWCWGGANAADLGLDGTFADPLTMPQRVPGVDALPEPIERFGVGARHLCAQASSGRLWCWGRNSSWQVGPINQLLVEEPYELDLGCPPQ